MRKDNPEPDDIEQLIRPDINKKDTSDKIKLNIITLTQGGMINRVNYDDINVQNRGGVGSCCIKLQDMDEVIDVVLADESHKLLILSSNGRCWSIPVSDIPKENIKHYGHPLDGIVFGKLKTEKRISQISSASILVPVEQSDVYKNKCLVMATEMGKIKLIRIEECFDVDRYDGAHIIRLDCNEGIDKLVASCVSPGPDALGDIWMTSSHGKIARINEHKIPVTRRRAMPVAGMELDLEDTILSVSADFNKKRRIDIVFDDGSGKSVSEIEFSSHDRNITGVSGYGKGGCRLVHAESDTEIMVVDSLGKCIKILELDMPRRSRESTRLAKIIKTENGIVKIIRKPTIKLAEMLSGSAEGKEVNGPGFYESLKKSQEEKEGKEIVGGDLKWEGSSESLKTASEGIQEVAEAAKDIPKVEWPEKIEEIKDHKEKNPIIKNKKLSWWQRFKNWAKG